jgi:putative aldouronate transport system substrate-binding protein
MKRTLLTWLLIVTLCLLAACAPIGNNPVSGTGSETSPPATTAETKASETTQKTEETKEPEVIALTILKNGSRPMNAQTDMIRQNVIDNLQVDMQMTQVAENFNQHLALLVSSGDIPDVIQLPFNTFVDYAKQGAFADITDLVGQNEDIMKYVGDYWDKIKIDGKIYGVPSIGGTPTSHVTNIRKDWLDKLNLSMPKTLDEFTNVMRAFTKNDPDGNGKDDTYGFSSAGFAYLSIFLGSFGATSSQHYFLNEDNTITTNAISDNYREGLKYLRDIFAEGLLDPELFTGNSSQAYQKFCRGEMGVWGSHWSHAGNAFFRYGLREAQPDAIVEITFPPVGKNGEQGSLANSPFSDIVAMSGELSDKEVKAAMRLLNFMSSQYGFYTVMYGVENVGFELDSNGALKWTYEIDGKDRLGNEVTDMEVYKLLSREKLARQIYGVSEGDSNKAYWDASLVQFDAPVRENIFALVTSDEYITLNPELEKYFIDNSIRFIMGEKDIDKEWDAYKQEYMRMGGEEVRQSLLKVYNERMGTNYTFAD